MAQPGERAVLTSRRLLVRIQPGVLRETTHVAGGWGWRSGLAHTQTSRVRFPGPLLRRPCKRIVRAVSSEVRALG